jgi:hypothetical protein
MKRKFLIKIKKLIEGKYFSTFASIFKWPGMEISEVRKYSFGDPLRYINRKTSAKHNELYTNLFHQEKDISLDVFFDINYNWRYWDIANRQLVVEFWTDILIYCKKNWIRIKIYFVEQKLFGQKSKINTINIEKHIEKWYNFIDQIYKITHKTIPVYNTWISHFLDTQKTNKHKRAIVIFSDFLDLSYDDKKTLKYLDKEYFLLLAKIWVNKNEWQNYNDFVLDNNIKMDVDELQTILLSIPSV